jgi:hypothetical protein
MLVKNFVNIQLRKFYINIYNSEQEAFNYISNIQLPCTLTTHLDLIKMILYFSWYRCEIEDRLYPQQVNNQLGRRMFLGYVLGKI